jgi:hypothetical protein
MKMPPLLQAIVRAITAKILGRVPAGYVLAKDERTGRYRVVPQREQQVALPLAGEP